MFHDRLPPERAGGRSCGKLCREGPAAAGGMAASERGLRSLVRRHLRPCLAGLAFLAALAALPVAAKGPSLEEKLLAEAESPRALADLYRLYERRDRSKDLSGVTKVLDQVAASSKARPDVKALALAARAARALRRP